MTVPNVRNPMRDRIAIVGTGSTQFGRDLGRSGLSLGLEAARKALRDAGVSRNEVDGICGFGYGYSSRSANALALQEGLGIPRLTWVTGQQLGAGLVHAAHAVFSGACEVALIVQATTREPRQSSSFRNPLRARVARFTRLPRSADVATRWGHESVEAFAAWAGRYMHDYTAPREVFGMIAVNARTNASKNPDAVMRAPLSMDEYLKARPIREPLGLLDCDLPVDAAQAMLVTTAERASRMRNKPVYIHAATFGQSGSGVESYHTGRNWTALAPWVTMPALWRKSDVTLNDVDLFYPYDGFTPISIAFTEAAGFCSPGDAWRLFRESWDTAENRLRLRGKTYIQTGGGSLSHGRLGGFNYYVEAVLLLRGAAGDRQIPNAKVALTGIGSLFHDPTAVLLRAD